MDYFLVLAGLVGLFFGGDWLVKGAVGLAARLGLSAFLISLTIVGFGTSLPELLVSVRAALDGAPGLALGNVIGSNIANIGLILGLAALIMPMRAGAGNTRDVLVMLGAAVLLGPVLWLGQISALAGGLMALGLCGYLGLTYYLDKGEAAPEAPELAEAGLDTGLWKLGLLLTGGLLLLVVGAELLVRGAVAIAEDFRVSDAVIGLTVVAVGTSLPELATSLTAALKGKADIAVGNVVGSNIFNILGILGITALVAPVPVAARFLSVDLWVLLAASMALTALLLLRGGFGRLSGAVFLTGYASYTLAMY